MYAQSVATVGNFDADGWTHISYTIPASATYYLQFGVEDVLDNKLFSAMGVDNVATATVIPAPGAFVLGVFGISLVWRMRRRRMR